MKEEEETTEKQGETREEEEREEKTKSVTSGCLPSLARSGPTLFPSTPQKWRKRRRKRVRQLKQSCETKQQDGGKSCETLERVDAESATT